MSDIKIDCKKNNGRTKNKNKKCCDHDNLRTQKLDEELGRGGDSLVNLIQVYLFS